MKLRVHQCALSAHRAHPRSAPLHFSSHAQYEVTRDLKINAPMARMMTHLTESRICVTSLDSGLLESVASGNCILKPSGLQSIQY